MSQHAGEDVCARVHATRITGAPRRRGYSLGMTWTRTHILAALALLLATSGCGPTKEEIAMSALVGLPIAMIVALGATLALRRAWGDELGFPPWGVSLLVVGLLLSGVMATSDEVDPELVAPILAYATPAIVGYSLLFARMRLAAPAERSVVLVPMFVTLVMALPFALVFGDLQHEQAELGLVVGIYAILGGALLSPFVVIGLVVERVMRARRATRLPLDSEGSPSDPSDPRG